MSKINNNPTVGIIMGSKSDWKGVMEHCSEIFKEFGINHDVRVISAHRTPERLERFIAEAEKKRLRSNYCSGWRGSPFSRGYCGFNNYTCSRCANAECNKWCGQPLLNCTNACWCSSCDFSYWKSWC